MFRMAYNIKVFLYVPIKPLKKTEVKYFKNDDPAILKVNQFVFICNRAPR